jgi:CO/xanthine dehydrogenase FAD-binding subunit
MQPFDYYQPQEYEEAFKFLNLSGKNVVALAGATDFIPTFRDGHWNADAVVDIKGLPGVRDLKETPEGLYIGAAVKMNELVQSPLVNSNWGILAEAARTVGSTQVRNRATIGGNMCTASPCADTPPALFVLEAQVNLKSAQGERCVPILEFFTWVRKTIVTKGELVTGLVIPKPPQGSAATYVKLSRRRGCDLSLVSVAVLAFPSASGLQWRIALGAVAPTIIRVPDAEAILSQGFDSDHIEKAAHAASNTARPISDVRSSERYRKAMVSSLTKRAIQETLAKMGKGG